MAADQEQEVSRSLGPLFSIRKVYDLFVTDWPAGCSTDQDGASVAELLIEACRRNNTDLLTETLSSKTDAEITTLLNETTTVMGNHLYHEAASQGNYLLLDQPSFECDPINRLEGDTPLHTAIRWLNKEPLAQRPFGKALVAMMLEAGSNPRVKNKGGLTALQLVDPSNVELRTLIQQHEYASQNAGDFITLDASATTGSKAKSAAAVGAGQGDSSDEDAEFSGSDDEERAEWERRRREKRKT
ncbi:ankyrin repeat domain containing protein [Moelleriella libera RCEF 2490]|uniref:Ankyrin repeat domain containing protein n=1 Tax=Moelleriella libera RCEF 2490 TaxID=1081109 RepID=A0A167WKI5_9HYPO|nr:ankyrin repeat domain containing protein [Moelleriella libera RCEF 2490]